jgi:hypothetical protein
MPILPRTLPALLDPQVEPVLQPRWSITRRHLMLSMAMPGLVVVLCAVMLALTVGAPGGFPGWASVLLLGALAPAVAFAWWLRRGGVAEPAGWVRAAVVVPGVQLILGVIPCLGVATTAGSGSGAAVAGVLFALTWVCGAVCVVAARRAQRALLTPIVPELGATAFALTVAVHFVLATPALVSARLEIGADHLGVTARLHRGRSAGPRVELTVRFAELHQVTPTVLDGEPALRPWLTLPDGTILYAQPGPALLLSHASGRQTVPVHDALVLAGLIDRRYRLWRHRERTGHR